MLRVSIALVVLCLSAAHSPADTIYHFTPDVPYGTTAQIDFSSSLPVSATSPWSLPTGNLGPALVTFFGVPQEGVIPVYQVSTSEVIYAESVSSDTGATIDSGIMHLTVFPFYSVAIGFGPGGAGYEGFEYYNSTFDPNSYAGFGYDGVWSLGPATYPAPEPSGLVLLGVGLGLAGVGGLAWHRRRAAA